MSGVAYETIAEVGDADMARVLTTALRGYGFHPLERDDAGPFALGAFTQRGFPIEVPEAEAGDARALAAALLADMGDRKSAT